MKKQSKKILQQFEDSKLDNGQQDKVKGGEDIITDDIIMI